MIKKAIILGVGVLGVATLLFGWSAASYVRTSAGYVTDSVRDAVPIEFEIQRARDMIEDLMPEVRKNMHLVAKEEVEVRRLEEQIARAEHRLDKEKNQLMRLRSDLATGDDVFHYAGRRYSADEVQADLANRFKRYKTGDATLESLKKMLAARRKTLDASREQLEGMLASKRQLQVEVENLAARLQMVEAARSTSEYQFDDSRLGKVKELIQGLRTRLDVSERLVNAETHFHAEIPLEEPSPEDIVDEVAEYFGEQPPEAEAVAKAD